MRRRLPPRHPPHPRAKGPPKLIVAISVDQFSADLFAEYRSHATGGLARLLQGAVFPAGYQSHAATETCPGHSTILTGYRPEHTGIIANNWIDQSVARPDKTVYCAEDETVPGSNSSAYTVSDKHLKVPTLGERMKAANPATRVVSVAGKDRAAVMMGGHKVDELWWWDGKAFVSYAGRATPPVVARANAATAAVIAQPQAALEVPAWCASHDQAVAIGGDKTVGTGRFDRAAGDAKAFRASPAFDASILALGAGLIQDMKLGKGPTTDIISIGASATDYVGHTYGTEGAEMCIQLAQLDRTLGGFFDVLDRTGVDYEVVLTADHGGNDLPERERDHGIADAQRVDLAARARGDGQGDRGQARHHRAGPARRHPQWRCLDLDRADAGAAQGGAGRGGGALLRAAPGRGRPDARADRGKSRAQGAAGELDARAEGARVVRPVAVGRSAGLSETARHGDPGSDQGLCRDAWQPLGL